MSGKEAHHKSANAAKVATKVAGRRDSTTLPRAPGNSARPLKPVPAGAKRAPMGARAIAGFIPKITQKAFEKHGFSAATMLTDWAAIVGPDLAAYTQPEKLKWPRGVEKYADIDDSSERGRPGATLILRVEGARALEIQYKAAQILDRINAYFGYQAITQMRILQAPVVHPARPAEPGYRKLKPSPQTPPDIAAIEDEPLREALRLMAAGLERRRGDA